jgi:hypothetical protein
MLEQEPTLDKGIIFYNYHLRMAKNKILNDLVLNSILLMFSFFFLFIAISANNILFIVIVSLFSVFFIIDLFRATKFIKKVKYLITKPFDDLELTKQNFYQLMYFYDYESRPSRKYARLILLIENPIMSYLSSNNSTTTYEHLDSAYQKYLELKETQK